MINITKKKYFENFSALLEYNIIQGTEKKIKRPDIHYVNIFQNKLLKMKLKKYMKGFVDF